MTVIEFYDRDVIENLCSGIALDPDRVILVGNSEKKLQKCAGLYQRVLSSMGKKTVFSVKVIPKTDIRRVTDAVCEIVDDYDDCVFDLTGGDELYLAAVGALWDRLQKRDIQIHRFNIKYDRITDCDGNGKTAEYAADCTLSVEDNIRIHGGEILDMREGKMPPGTAYDINLLWAESIKDPKLWNSAAGILAQMKKSSKSENKLTSKTDYGYYLNKTEKAGCLNKMQKFLHRLKEQGLIKELVLDGRTFSVTYKNEIAEKCLTTSGIVLEMKIAMEAANASDKHGAVYDDVKSGVSIDWKENTDKSDTSNEIDVVMMHGMVPVFVSCKNGGVDADELFKLNTVAHRFGGKYAKMVLVTTALDGSERSERLRRRANDMNITVFEGDGVKKLGKMTGEEIQKALSSLWL